MKLRSLALATAAMVALLSGCSDDSGSNDGDGIPAADDLVELLREQGMDDDMAECMGAAYEAAGFTADDIDAMGDSPPDPDSEKYQRLAEEVQACTATDISVPAGG
ncbi:MAG: hypothetical protein GX643_02410 [Acidimicrobiales bacterium]|nr:hypothetical protein [Acidimicrobiales bacterium]